MSTPDDLFDVVVDVFDPLEALDGTIKRATALVSERGEDLIPRAIAEVAIRHSFYMAGDAALKQEFWERAESATGMTPKEILAYGAGT